MKKSIKSVMTFALAASMVASSFAPAATVSAASKKANVITKATYNSGSTVKYSYNGKGLVTKSVSTRSWKGSSSDTSETITTTYKYNKKNKISSKTEKDVTKYTNYEVDKTTGLKLGAKTGTYTETVTTVTNFTYDKKGLATQSVATTTTVKSGDTTSTSKTRFSSGSGSYTYEMADGSVIAGYNSRNNDGSEKEDSDELTKDSAYYYEGSVADTEKVYTYTTKYTDNGNGTYTVVETSDENSGGYSTERVYKYFGREYDANGAETLIPVTKEQGDYSYTDSYGNTHTGNGTYYKKADGSVFSTYSYNVIELTDKVVIKKDADATSKETSTTTKTISDKDVTTTKYTYDKKKRVKKAVSTTVFSYESKQTNNYVDTYTSATGSSKDETNSMSESSSESTGVVTTTYTYNKKGFATKVVESDEGKEDSKTVSSSMTVNKNHESTSKNEDGSTTTHKSSSSYECAAGYPTVKTTVVQNGVSTITTTKNPYKYTSSSENVYKDSSNKSSETNEITYYGNGGKKVVSTYEDSYSNTYNGTTSSSTKTGTKTSYDFDEKGKSNGYIDVYKYSSNGGAPTESSDAHYTDGKESSNDVAATQKIDAAKGALEASGTVFNKIEGTKAVLATPSKYTTTYKYDKAGNVKSAKCSGTETKIEDVVNETYGNTIYEWDASGELVAQQVAVTHKKTNNDAMENTVKKGTKVLTKKITTNKESYDRSSSSYSTLSKALFTIKGKKSSAASVAKKQQWIIQNGALNGAVGLN